MAKVYHDRGIVKWAPFNALESHNEYLQAMYKKRRYIEKASLSQDEYDQLNYKLETAYNFQQLVEIKYYRCGEILYISGIIYKIDSINGTLLLNNGVVPCQDVLGMDIL